MKQKAKLTEPEPKDKNFFGGAPEISIFVACCVMVNELRGLERAVELGDINQAAFEQKSKAVLDRLNQAAQATQRFDVVLPVMEGGQFSPFFWRWFNWWDDYLKGLSPSQVAETERHAREHGSFIQELRPKGNWLMYRDNPAIIFTTDQSDPDQNLQR